MTTDSVCRALARGLFVCAWVFLLLAGESSALGQVKEVKIEGPGKKPEATSKPAPVVAHLEGTKALPLPKEATIPVGEKASIKLALISSGKFTMGSPDGEKERSAYEGPQREVTITKPYYMGATEVTQAQYEAVMGKNPSSFKGPQNPVESVSWDDAVEFCMKLSEKTGKKVRLPTEAEWEYACRAGTKTRFTFGDNDADLGDYAWYGGNSKRKTHPVGGKKPNAFGLYDMPGNVWDWCGDWYADSYANAKNVDPTGPDSGCYRVLRGGSWSLYPRYCRSAVRNRHEPDFRYYVIGFRVVVVVGGVD